MTDRTPDPDLSDRAAQSENGDLMRLLEVAGPRRSAPARVVAKVKQATYPAWQAKVEAVAQARRRRRMWTLAAAASLLVSVGLVLWRVAPIFSPTTSVRVAWVESVRGAVHGGAAGSDDLAVGIGIDAGSTIETGVGSHTTLRLAGGTSARLDAGTIITFATETALELERGAVYLDTGSATSETTLEVTTRYGVARDIGTQFEVRLLEDALRIQVREGEVEVDLGETSHAAGAGTALRVDDAGAVTEQDVPAYGSAWGWVLNTSPTFELEGRTLGEFLEWVARETGWHMRFADPSLELEVLGTVVHGSIGTARPDQALDLVLPGSGLHHRVENGTLWIEQAGVVKGE